MGKGQLLQGGEGKLDPISMALSPKEESCFDRYRASENGKSGSRKSFTG
jgi:hypothetical protein